MGGLRHKSDSRSLVRLLALYRFVECTPDRLAAEFSVESDEELVKRYSPRRAVVAPVLITAFLYSFLGFAVLITPNIPPMIILIVAIIESMVGIFVYFILRFNSLPFRYQRIEIGRINRKFNVTIVTAAGKVRHMAVPFERILHVNLTLYSEPKVMKISVDLKPDDTFKERWKNDINYYYQLYLGQHFEGVLNIEKYLRELFLHVEVILSEQKYFCEKLN